MISKIKLTDFQAHRNTEIDFHPGITVITGPGNKGKTSIFRALRVVFQNHIPQLTDYCTKNVATKFEVEVDVDGHKITRVKGTHVPEGKKAKVSINDYYIDGKAAGESIGKEIPAEVLKATRIHPVKFSATPKLEFDLQLQNQFEPYFLIFSSGEEKLKFLNRLSGSYIVDLAIKDVQTDLKAAKEKVEALESKIKDSQEEADKIAAIVGPFSILLSKIKEKYALLEQTYARVQKLTQLKEEFDWWQNNKSALVKTEEILNYINTDAFEFALDRLDNLRNLNNDFFYTTQQLDKINLVNERVQALQLESMSSVCERTNNLRLLSQDYVYVSTKLTNFDNILAKIKLINIENNENLINRVGYLRTLSDDFVTTTNEISGFDNSIKQLEVEKTNAVSSYAENLRNTPICPQCNRKITAKCVEDIIKELSNE